jgi:chitinase
MPRSRALRRHGAAALFAAIAVAASSGPAAAGKRWVSGYLVGYERALQPPATIDFESLTHLMIGRYVPKPDGTLDRSCDWDASRCPAWARAMGARAHAAKRKAILFLGGGGSHDAFAAAAKPARRATLVANVVAAVRDLGFDGVDIDWEPVEAADVADLVALVKALRTAMPRAILTMPVGFTNMNFPQEGIGWVKTVAPLLDQINIMTYDMAGNWGWTKTWHAAAFDGATAETPTSVVVSVKSYLDLGIPAAKLGIGFGFYGQCWTGGATGPRQPVGSSVMADTLTYATIMDRYAPIGARRWDATAKVPYLGRAGGLGPKRCSFISYEDPRSIAAKVAWAKSKGLGGAIIWTIADGWRASIGTNAPLKAVGRMLK